jgi:hypothetical protein
MKPIRLTVSELQFTEIWPRQTFVITVDEMGVAEIKHERAPGIERDTSIDTFVGVEPSTVELRLAVEVLP